MICFDMMRNIYTYYKLSAVAYLLNEVFRNDHGELATHHIDARAKQGVLIGLGYIIPMIALHAWELVKVKVDVNGHSRAFLQKSIITRYLNYTAESRQKVDIAEIEIAIREDSQAVANAYTGALALLRTWVKIVVLFIYVRINNPQALSHVSVMLAMMLLFVVLRSGRLSKAQERSIVLSEKLLSYTAEIGRNYRLIANYAQRPQVNDEFDLEQSSCPWIVKMLPKAPMNFGLCSRPTLQAR